MVSAGPCAALDMSHPLGRADPLELEPAHQKPPSSFYDKSRLGSWRRVVQTRCLTLPLALLVSSALLLALGQALAVSDLQAARWHVARDLADCAGQDLELGYDSSQLACRLDDPGECGADAGRGGCVAVGEVFAKGAWDECFWLEFEAWADTQPAIEKRHVGFGPLGMCVCAEGRAGPMCERCAVGLCAAAPHPQTTDSSLSGTELGCARLVRGELLPALTPRACASPYLPQRRRGV